MDNSTRDKLLEVAERLFALEGYDGVSIREITRQAGCNVSSVNYHFGGKKGLYLAVFKERIAKRAFELQDTFRSEVKASGKDLRSIIRALARAYLLSPFSEQERLNHHRLMSREAHQPTEAFQYMMKEVMLPFFKEVCESIKINSRKDISEEQLRIRVIGVFAVFLHFSMARTMVSRLTGRSYSRKFLEELAEELTEFCLHGVEG